MAWKETTKQILKEYWWLLEILFILGCIQLVATGNITARGAVILFIVMNLCIAAYRIWVYWDLFYNTIQYVTLLIFKMQGRLNTNDAKLQRNKKRNPVAKQTKKDV